MMYRETKGGKVQMKIRKQPLKGNLLALVQSLQGFSALVGCYGV